MVPDDLWCPGHDEDPGRQRPAGVLPAPRPLAAPGPRPGCRAGRTRGSAGSPRRSSRSRSSTSKPAVAEPVASPRRGRRPRTPGAPCAPGRTAPRRRRAARRRPSPSSSYARNQAPPRAAQRPRASRPRSARARRRRRPARGVLAAGRAGDLDVVQRSSPTPCRPRRRDGTAARRRAGPLRVRRPQPPLELLLEAAAEVVGQRLERRPRAGAGDPGEHRVLALEDVQVRRLPGVDRRSRGRAGRRR